MTTLAALKAQIWDDLYSQDDLDPATNPQIETAIKASITHYQRRRFFFTETRDKTFQTVNGQIWYGAASDADIPTFVSLDAVFLERVGGDSTSLSRTDPIMFERLTDNGASRGEPYQYAVLNRQIGLYPIPDGAYTVRPIGQTMVPAPADDTEIDNPWMTDAAELIRCKAKTFLFAHTKQNLQMASAYKTMEMEALSSLMSETTLRAMNDGFTKTSF